MRLFCMLLLVVSTVAAHAAPSDTASSLPAKNRIGIIVGWDSATNTHLFNTRQKITDNDIIVGALFRPQSRWYIEAIAGYRTAPYSPALHARISTAYQADTFGSSEINITMAFELATEQWYDDSSYVQIVRHKAATSGITPIEPNTPYFLSYQYYILIPKLFIGLEPNIALNQHLRLVCRYGFELRFIPSGRQLTFETTDDELNTDNFIGASRNDAHTELGRKFTLGLQYLF